MGLLLVSMARVLSSGAHRGTNPRPPMVPDCADPVAHAVTSTTASRPNECGGLRVVLRPLEHRFNEDVARARRSRCGLVEFGTIVYGLSPNLARVSGS